MEHTPERLIREGRMVYALREIPNDSKGKKANCLCCAFSAGGGNMHIFPDTSLEDARRMQAAWMACSGIPTEALEVGVVKEMIDALERAKQFIVNGIEFKYIQMPEAGDPAIETLPKIKTVLSRVHHAD